MNILVLNGSPKGDNSVTMAYVKYLKTVLPQHNFEIKHVAQSIHRLENDSATFDSLMVDVKTSDGILWAFPLYFLLVHSNYKRFIELIWERNQQTAFTGKYAALLSTSIHFFDHTAHNYIHGISEDLGMNFVRSFSAEMNDLMLLQERKNLVTFAVGFIDSIQRKDTSARVFPKLVRPSLEYHPEFPASQVDPAGQRLVIVTESDGRSANLEMMMKRFLDCFPSTPTIVDLSKIKIAGACLGCLKCGIDNECAFDGKDDVRDTYENVLRQADIIVYAATMKDRYFSSRWKIFIDRRFYSTHQPGLPDKQVGYLVSGPLAYESNLRQILTASAEIDQANLVGIVTDEFNTSPELDSAITCFAENLVRNSLAQAKMPRTFLGIGGAKIFRDEMWGNLRAIFQADYRYYKKHGMLDFPQSRIGTRLFHLFVPLLRFKPVKDLIQKNTKSMMHRAHDQVIKKAEADIKRLTAGL
jgi:multimeric flavodoxin WrbA